ncbi:MAG: peptidylprolyl isomerase [Candidatus Bipolaricaulota bacterium]|nr:peptidylprolyl isomerase [Candidatus Bipolaricaulota bacterium]
MDFSRRSLFVSLLISLLIFSSFAAVGQESTNQAGTTVLATVNGEEITQQELSQASQVQQIVMTLSRQFRSFSQFLMTSEAGQNFLSEYRKYVLDQLINQKLTVQKVEELGINVSDQAVQEEITKIVEENQQFSDKSDLEGYLKDNQNMTLENLKTRIRENLKTQKLRERVTDKVTVSEEEVEAFYNQNKQSYTDQEGNVRPLDEVSDQVRNTVRSQKQNEAYNQWLQEERKKADIEKNLDQM